MKSQCGFTYKHSLNKIAENKNGLVSAKSERSRTNQFKTSITIRGRKKKRDELREGELNLN